MILVNISKMLVNNLFFLCWRVHGLFFTLVYIIYSQGFILQF